MKLNDGYLMQLLKTNNVFLNKDMEVSITEQVKARINFENVSTYHQLTSYFNNATLLNFTSDYIQRGFTMVAKTENFLQLEFNLIDKLLSSSELHISSELEVFHAANDWLCCDDFDRSQYAEKTFLKIRFPLLSYDATKSVLQKPRGSQKSSFFHENDDSIMLIVKVLHNKQQFYKTRSSSYYTNRYCNSEKFSIFVGEDIESDVSGTYLHQIEENNLQTSKLYTQLPKWMVCNVICLKGELYAFCYYDDKARRTRLRSFINYSPLRNTWENLDNYSNENISYYCACSFIDSIFVLGGGYDLDDDFFTITSSCFEFNVNDKKWKELSMMRDQREHAACAVFNGKIVVSGGYNFTGDHLRSVESYDHISDTWTYMANMINARICHDLIAVSNKLFAIGGKTMTFEVYDTFSEKFVALNLLPRLENDFRYFGAYMIGRNIMVFGKSPKVYFYNVDSNEWYEGSCEITNYKRFYLSKLPQI